MGMQQNVTCQDEIAYSMQVTQHPVARLGPVESICWRPVVKFAGQEGIPQRERCCSYHH